MLTVLCSQRGRHTGSEEEAGRVTPSGARGVFLRGRHGSVKPSRALAKAVWQRGSQTPVYPKVPVYTGLPVHLHHTTVGEKLAILKI